jgi:hypothetical protein
MNRDKFTLYDVLSVYELRHLVEHLIEADRSQDIDDIEMYLTDFEFIKAKCIAGQRYNLMGDYLAAYSALPDMREQHLLEHEN